MSTDPIDGACTEGVLPLGKFEQNRAHDTRLKETGNGRVARTAVGKENDTQMKVTRARRTTPKGNKCMTTPKKLTLIATRDAAIATAVKTPLPPKSHRKTKYPKYHAITSSEHAKFRRAAEEQRPGEEDQGEPSAVTGISHLGKPGGMIRSGPVRVRTPLKSAVRHTPERRKRVGIDGTSRTPSKQLLRSTACSRGQQIPHLRGNEGVALGVGALSIVDQSSEELDESMDSCLRAIDLECENTTHANNHSEIGRRDFTNPVALTLLNDGQENWQYLLEKDRAPTAFEQTQLSSFDSPPPKRGDIFQLDSPLHNVTKVSNNLWEVKNQEEVSSIARPKALAASGKISLI